MPSKWKATGLSVNPPSHEIADTDRASLQFSAGEPITTATAVLTDLELDQPVGGPVESVEVLEEAANVIVSGLTRNKTYELAVTFTRFDGTRWTRTLILECVS